MVISNENPAVSPPVVSVVIPTYNRRVLLEQTLESLRNQTFQDYEIIVCDDHSTDGTYQFLCSLKWPNLKVLRNDKNLNLPGTMTRLFSMARGKYIGMQHDHDLYEPTFLEKMVALMELHPSAGFGYCAYSALNENNCLVEYSIAEANLFPATGLLRGKEFIRILATQINTPVPAMGTIFRRDVVEKAGGYRPDWFLAADEDLYLRVASISDVAYSWERLFTMRLRPYERNQVIGSWRILYTLHEFRTEATKKYLQEGLWYKQFNVIRLRLLRNYYLWGESVSLWLHGEEQQLKKALQFDTIPQLPTRRPFLNLVEALALRLWVLLLGSTKAFGKRFGSLRAKKKLNWKELT